MAIREYLALKPKINPTAYIEKTAEIIGDVRIGMDSSVWNGAVLRGDMHFIEIGRNSSVQDNAVMHGTENKYPTIVGDNVSIGHGAIVHGCTIGDNCLIGMGSIILEGAVIGDWCIIGAGALVTEGARVPKGSIVLGVPGKVVKKVTKAHKDRITRNWQNYVKLKNSYMMESEQ
ncbi:MAG: gamma carbonic anhydrase family protein [Candidatus Micrarchaeota archaeon]|nr:gamma carbonic anhydrase family protein [Candidatus Micrarchaeota archaeon]